MEVKSNERTVPSAEEVRRQLGLLLGSEMFRSSKRCPAFLEFVVERTLEGRGSELREKVIGVEVFQRHPGYDSNEDPVVRATAGDVRKRLAQYYQDPARAGELRILLQPGSYVPEFRTVGPAVGAVEEESPEAGSTAADVSGVEGVEPAPATRPGRKWWVGAAAMAILTVAGAGWWMARSGGRTAGAFDRFWDPLVGSPGPVLVCVGQTRVYNFPLSKTPEMEKALAPNGPTPSGMVALRDIQPIWDRYVPLGDAEALSRFAILLDRQGRAYRVRGSAHTSLADLREGPAILIGAFSNDWTLRVSKDLRFRLARTKDDRRYVEDAQQPEFRGWTGAIGNAFQGNSTGGDFPDYAIISRVFDQTTGKPLLSVGGITHLGTAAAGEFLTTPGLMNEGLRSLGAGWEKKNVQMVIEVKVIGNSATPPRLVATHVW